MRVAPTKKLTPLFLDFETYWSRDFTLRTTPMGDYVRDPQFKIHCVAAKVGKNKTKLFTDVDDFKQFLDAVDWDSTVLVGHNLYFDGFILTELFGVVPAAYHCTMSMSRGIWRNTCAHNLDALALRLGLKGKVKAEALVNTKDKRDLSKAEMRALGAYCIDDVDDTAAAYNIMLPYIPDIELEIISHTVRCFTEPLLIINAALLEEAIEEVEERRKELLDRVANFIMVNCPDIQNKGDTPAQSLARTLRSRIHFPNMLIALGIEPPMKVSPRTGKQTYALAAKDPEYMALTEDEDPMVRLICEARSEFASNQTMTRAQRLLSATEGGKTLPIMYLYCGAHTMRWSASNKMNLQNLQRGSKLRKAIEAPPGYVLMVGDSGQIEARVVAWIAGQENLIEGFRLADLGLDLDVYCKFAADIYNRVITKDDEDERFVGKTAILGLGFGMGWKKFYSTMVIAGRDIAAHDCQSIVNLYRSKYEKIPELWRKLDQVLSHMASGGTGFIELADGELVLEYEADKIWMPNGLALHYPGLRNVFDEEGRHTGYEFLYVKGRNAFWKKIYGGLLTENIVQCLARIVVGEQIVEIAHSYRVVMTTHDECVMLVPDNKKAIAKAEKFMLGKMGTPSEWCQSLPVTSEVKHAYNYSK